MERVGTPENLVHLMLSLERSVMYHVPRMAHDTSLSWDSGAPDLALKDCSWSADRVLAVYRGGEDCLRLPDSQRRGIDKIATHQGDCLVQLPALQRWPRAVSLLAYPLTQLLQMLAVHYAQRLSHACKSRSFTRTTTLEAFRDDWSRGELVVMTSMNKYAYGTFMLLCLRWLGMRQSPLGVHHHAIQG